LCADLRRILDSHDEAFAFSATMTLALVSELIVASPTGTIFPNELGEPEDREEALVWRALRSLRNACCHPAAVSRRAPEVPHVDILADRIRERDARLAWRLDRDRGALRSTEMLRMALTLVNQLGRTYLDQFRGVPRR